MTPRANAVKTVFSLLTDDVYERTQVWFKEHPNEPFAYWARDTYIAIKDKDNKELLAQHPEIENINDHTMLKPRPDGKGTILYGFCPDLKKSVAELMDAGCANGMTDKGIYWWVRQDPERDGNFIAEHVRTSWTGTKDEWELLTDIERGWFLAVEGII